MVKTGGKSQPGSSLIKALISSCSAGESGTARIVIERIQVTPTGQPGFPWIGKSPQLVALMGVKGINRHCHPILYMIERWKETHKQESGF